MKRVAVWRLGWFYAARGEFGPRTVFRVVGFDCVSRPILEETNARTLADFINNKTATTVWPPASGAFWPEHIAWAPFGCAASRPRILPKDRASVVVAFQGPKSARSWARKILTQFTELDELKAQTDRARAAARAIKDRDIATTRRRSERFIPFGLLALSNAVHIPENASDEALQHLSEFARLTGQDDLSVMKTVMAVCGEVFHVQPPVQPPLPPSAPVDAKGKVT